MANIRVDLNKTIKDGSAIMFRSPVDCSAITGLIVYYVAEDGAGTSKEFVLADAHGHNVGDIDHLFAENAVVKVILDVTAGMAYVQNADTNAYIERTFIKTGNLCIIDATNGWSSIDKTYEEIQAAYAAGKTLVLYSGGQTYNLVKADNGFVFERYYVEGTKLVIGRCSLEKDMIFHLDRASVIELSGGPGGTVTDEQIKTVLDAYMADNFGGNTVPDCVITSNIHPTAGSGYNFAVASGSLMNVWEKVHNGEKPRVLLKFLVGDGSDSDNYIAEAHAVEHYASGGTPSWLCISFVVNDELFAFESVSPDSITGNVITSHTVTKLGGVHGGTGMSNTAKNLLITILRNGVYSTDQSANITSLASELGVIESDTPVIPDDPDEPHTHSYTSSVTNAATCETDGVRTYVCTCGHSYTQTIPATGHNYVDGTCTNCGAADPDAEVGGFGWVSGAEIAYTVIPDEYVSKTDGSFIPEPNGYDRTDYIYCYGADYITITNGSAYNAFYDVSKRFIRSFGASDYVEIPENAVYFVCSAATLEGFSCKLYKKAEPTWTSGVPYDFNIVKNEYININDGADTAYDGWDRTDFVNCVGASKLVRTDSGGDVKYNFFYDVEKKAVFGFHFDSNKKEVEVPKRACYFKMSGPSATMDGLVVVPYA